MDYHADRFEDCSWVVRDGGRIAALLPANITPDGVLHSHGGLTYGGWILPQSHYDGEDLLNIFTQAIEEWRQHGIKALDYKPLPYIYTARPGQEDLYTLFRLGAERTECNLSEAAIPGSEVMFNTLQRRHLRKAEKLPLTIEESEDVEGFMRMLSECLAERHNTQPVHTAAEIRLLKERFPSNIKIYIVRQEGETRPDAGVLVYDTGRVAHLQYIATTAEGREKNLLTPLIYKLLTETYRERAYLDFGISNEDRGRYLNAGLLRQKFSYGATGVAYERYMLKI